MTRASTAPAWVLEALRPLYAPLLLEPLEDRQSSPDRGAMAATRARWFADMTNDAGIAAHVAAVLERRGRGLVVELPYGRRGVIVRAWEPSVTTMLDRDTVTWQTIGAEPFGRDFRRGAAAARGRELTGADPVRAAALVDVEILEAPHDVIRVEVERVTVPAPADGDLEAFMARKRAPGWKRPPVKMTTQHDEPRARRGTPKTIGIGSAVRYKGSNDRPWLVIDQAPGAGFWWFQDQETGKVSGEAARFLENLGPYFGKDGAPLELEGA